MKSGKKPIALGLVLVLGSLGCAGLLFHRSVPTGTQGAPAEQLTDRIEASINIHAWQETGVIEWTFPRGHNHLWDRQRHWHRLQWDGCTAWINLSTRQGHVECEGKPLEGADLRERLDDAWSIWANDSFWLNPLAKLRDKGTERRLVTQEDNKAALLVTYRSGGVTPGDSYLWTVDEKGQVTACTMWVQIIPIDGLEFSWDNWQTLDTGARVATRHRGPLGFTIELTNIRAGFSVRTLYPESDPFAPLNAQLDEMP